VKKSTQDLLEERRSVWKSKEVIRRLYLKWYGLIKECLRPGKTLELGGGSGNLSEFLPEAITSDIVFEPWLDAVMDAHFLPFKDDSLENIVLFDVLHHLAAPAIFFCEAERVLRPEGRMVLIEPYVSRLSRPVYRFLHSEGMKWNVDPLQGDPSGAKEPFQGNQAVPTLLFEKHRGRLLEKVPRLKIVREEKMDTLIYPLSGGFHNPSLCPMFLYPALERLERWLQPMDRFLAFRMLVVLEKG
jgi:SAM-dependent methyltransferase